MCEHYKNAFGLNYKQITQMPREEFANLYGKQWLAYSPSKFLKMIRREAKSRRLSRRDMIWFSSLKSNRTSKWKELKIQLVNGYGGKCTCCGENRIEFLTLEHLEGDGKEHRAKFSMIKLYQDVIDRKFPQKYTVYCMNCNFATRYGKICPHKRIKKELDYII